MFICLLGCKKEKKQKSEDNEKFVIISSLYKDQSRYSVVWTETGRKVFTPGDGFFLGAHILYPNTEKETLSYYGFLGGKVIFYSNGVKQELAKTTGKVSLPFQIGEKITSHIKDEKGNTYIFCDGEFGSGSVIGNTAYYYKISANGELSVKAAGNGLPIIADVGVEYLSAFTNDSYNLLCYYTKEDFSMEAFSFNLINFTKLRLHHSVATKEKVYFILSTLDGSSKNTGYLLVSLDLKTKQFKQQKIASDVLDLRIENSCIFNNTMHLIGSDLTKNAPFHSLIDLTFQSDSQNLIKNNLPVKASPAFGYVRLIDVNLNGVLIAGYQAGSIYWKNGALNDLDHSGLEPSSPEFIMSY